MYAKYKEKWGEVIRTGNWDDVREDVFQVMSYMYALKAATGGIVCPFNGELDSYKDKEIYEEINVNGEGYKISKEIEDRFYVLPLLVSKAEKKEEFFEEMKENEEKLAKEVAEL